jgi:hypothetical protein
MYFKFVTSNEELYGNINLPSGSSLVKIKQLLGAGEIEEITQEEYLENTTEEDDDREMFISSEYLK